MTSHEKDKIKESIHLKTFIGDTIGREVSACYTPKFFQQTSQEKPKMIGHRTTKRK